MSHQNKNALKVVPAIFLRIKFSHCNKQHLKNYDKDFLVHIKKFFPFIRLSNLCIFLLSWPTFTDLESKAINVIMITSYIGLYKLFKTIFQIT